PGGQSIGWSNIEDKGWTEMRHSLDSLKSSTLVQFRIAYGSEGTYNGNKGFAFDNIWIGEREKVVLLEHFTNSSDTFSRNADDILRDIISSFRKDVISLQYHTSFPGSDALNGDNPVIPESRVFYYGIQSVPYTLLDGGNINGHRFDYYLRDIDKRDIMLQSLRDPYLRLNIQTDYGVSYVDIEADIEALTSIPLSELTLHVVILEKEITGIEGENGEERYRDVVKALVPDQAGTYIYKSWQPGDHETLYYTWKYEKVYDVSQLRVVAFIQDENTKEVYQSAIDKYGIVSTVTDKPVIIGEHMFDIIPNPAIDYFMIRFKYPLKTGSYMTITSMDGRVIRNDIIEAGIRVHIIDTKSFTHGIYVINVISDNQMLGAKRILINCRQ
ncbi:MAG: T9SS type A sorting domain-containing protein, partial [Bacteroidales bacterium]|nr:T9SS type A sorting domain-containing protein [Bacteroidales bacterium]